MNLTKLFEMQRELDERIVKEKGLEGQDLLPQKILALQVELGECANEWRGFKFWSNRQKANTEIEVICSVCNGTGDENWEASLQLLSEGHDGLDFEPCTDCNATGKLGKKNPLLEEYIDCLHFILSIGMDINRKTPIGMKDLQGLLKWAWENDYATDTTRIFNATFDKLGDLSVYPTPGNYEKCFSRLLLIGKLLGFTWDQIEEAYMAKNSENHRRQSTGY